MKKIIFITFGSISLGLGTLGIFLPILPTTPFLLISAYFYYRSSEKLHTWLLNHKLFGPIIYDYVTYKRIPLKAKISAVSLIVLSVGFTIYLLNNIYLQIGLAVIATTVILYILSIPTKKSA